jgi:tRNA threonylcarbamoyladenosine biosynthesis protein TsaE
MEIEVILNSLAETRSLGRRLAGALPHDVVCLLRGDLAAGKTTLIKAICEGLGVNPNLVISPTYTIANWYEGTVPICHVDFYRLESIDDIYNLDTDDWLNPEGPTFIEWPELALPLLEGIETLDLAIQASASGDSEERRVRLRADSDHYQSVFEALRSWKTLIDSPCEGVIG